MNNVRVVTFMLVDFIVRFILVYAIFEGLTFNTIGIIWWITQSAELSNDD